MDNSQPDQPKGDILIVDDTLPNLQVLYSMLTKHGYKVRGASNGPTALIIANEQPPDLILLDIKMPEMDGYQVCQRLKGKSQTRDIPVIFLSVLDETADKVKGFAVGGIDYITKPFQAEEILARVNTHLALHKLQKQLEAQNVQLQREIRERMQAEEALQRAHDELERRVEERTAELAKANAELKMEISERKQAEESLREAKEFSDSLITAMQDGFSVLDAGGVHIDVNPALCQMTGFSRKELIGVGPPHPYWPAEAYEEIERAWQQALRGEFGDFELTFMRKKGERFPVIISPSWIKDGQGNIVNYFATVKDITERKQAEDALQESEVLLRSTVEAAPIILFTLDTNGIFQLSTGAGLKSIGLKPGEVVGLSHFEIYKDLESANENVRRALKGESVKFINEALGVIWDICYSPLYDPNNSIKGMVGTAIDITERVWAEEQIKASLAEKEVLLQELYHRTRNNMSVISAMLALQSSNIQDERMLSIFRETENRIRSMALVHQKLYQSQDLSRIDLGEYIDDLAALLAASYGVSPDKVALTLDAESASVLIDTAIPCGLILNELISNAFRHAFPDERSGEVQIRLRQEADGTIVLQVSDDGIGVPEGFDLRKSDSLGLHMVLGIVERQLQGEVVVETDRGMAWQIRFRDDQYGPRV